MQIAIVAPAPADASLPRADRYTHAIAEALRGEGHVADLVAAHDWRAIAPGARLVVDGRCLHALAADVDALVARGAVGLVHDAPPPPPGSEAHDGELLRAAETAFYGRLSCIIASGAMAGEQVQATHGVAAELVRVVVPGTPDAHRSLGSGGPGCAILSLGARTPDSGHELLLRALARLFDLDWHCTIAGDARLDADHARMLDALADELAIADRVTFSNALAADALEMAWRGTDLFALASVSDGYGTPIADAVRRGIPVAVTAGESARALIGPTMGAVCAPGDRDTLSKSLRRMIFDTELRLTMAEDAWTRGRMLPDWPTQARAFAEALRA